MVSRNDLELDSTLHLLVELAYLRDIPQSNVVNGGPETTSNQKNDTRRARNLRGEVTPIWERDDARDDTRTGRVPENLEMSRRPGV